MNFKLEKYDYVALSLKYIPNKDLARQIQTHIDFVENYVDRVEELFPNVVDQQIMYKQLGIITFSCTESLWKGLVYTINMKCHTKKCSTTCPYIKFNSEKKLNTAKIRDIIDHLQNMRLIRVSPFEMFGIESLQQLRNHTHLTRLILEGDKSDKFNKNFVENMLRLYYVTFNQLEANNRFLDDKSLCIKDLDGNAYEQTKLRNKEEFKTYIGDSISNMTYELFYDKPLNEDKQQILKCLSLKENFNEDTLADSIGRLLYYASARFQSETKYQTKIEMYYKKIKKYLHPKSNLIEKIKQRITHYYNLYNEE